jgi:hypothetical protein
MQSRRRIRRRGKSRSRYMFGGEGHRESSRSHKHNPLSAFKRAYLKKTGKKLGVSERKVYSEF